MKPFLPLLLALLCLPTLAPASLESTPTITHQPDARTGATYLTDEPAPQAPKPSKKKKATQAQPAGNQLLISFEFRRGGIASSQYALWIEDAEGRLVRTIYATAFTVRRGYTFRPDALPLWVSKADIPARTPDQIDALTGATPRNGALTYTWDGTDDQGKPLPDATYTFYLEATTYWQSRTIYSGTFQWGSPTSATIPLTVQHIAPSDRNTDMITNLQAQYLPLPTP